MPHVLGNILKNMNGFLLIDKGKGMTSFDVVRDVRRVFCTKKVGHAGTLDPLATGLLIVAVGEATKLLELFVGLGKEYEVKAHFGYSSDTYDAEGKIVEVDANLKLSKKEILEKINELFLGEIEQIPPKYSALKIDGKKACDVIRAGGEIEMKPRKIRIDAFDIIDFKWPHVSFRVKCSSGTYIRSLIHDLGMAFKCCAYVEELRRTKVGEFLIEDSVNSNELNKNTEQNLISISAMAKKFDFWQLDGQEFNLLDKKGVILNKKIDQDCFVLAFFGGKIVGVLEKAVHSDGVKFRKRIFE